MSDPPQKLLVEDVSKSSHYLDKALFELVHILPCQDQSEPPPDYLISIGETMYWFGLATKPYTRARRCFDLALLDHSRKVIVPWGEYGTCHEAVFDWFRRFATAFMEYFLRLPDGDEDPITGGGDPLAAFGYQATKCLVTQQRPDLSSYRSYIIKLINETELYPAFLAWIERVVGLPMVETAESFQLNLKTECAETLRFMCDSPLLLPIQEFDWLSGWLMDHPISKKTAASFDAVGQMNEATSFEDEQGLTFCDGRKMVFYGGKPLNIDQHAEYQVLKALIEREEEVVPHAQLYNATKADPEDHVSHLPEADGVVRNAVGAARKALKEAGASYEIRATRGKGYSLCRSDRRVNDV